MSGPPPDVFGVIDRTIFVRMRSAIAPLPLTVEGALSFLAHARRR